MNWTGAACLDTPEIDFFPTRGEPTAPALAVCARCPVTRTCLVYALAHHIQCGVWGGTTERQRRALRRQLKEAS